MFCNLWFMAGPPCTAAGETREAASEPVVTAASPASLKYVAIKKAEDAIISTALGHPPTPPMGPEWKPDSPVNLPPVELHEMFCTPPPSVPMVPSMSPTPIRNPVS